MNTKKISFLFLFPLIPTVAMSVAVGLSQGHGALLYDATQSNGPNPHNGNKPTNLAGQNVFALYTKGFGPASVAAYRTEFPSALILAIIDADLDSLPLLSNQTVGVNVANMLTPQLFRKSKKFHIPLRYLPHLVFQSLNNMVLM